MTQDLKEFANLGRRLGDLFDLPTDIIRQLQITKINAIDRQILTVIDELYNGMANIDEIMVGLYRKFQRIEKRSYLSNKLYRLSQNQYIHTVRNKKGIYTTLPHLKDYYSR